MYYVTSVIMKTEVKRYYDVFNTATGKWEKKIMTAEQHRRFVRDINRSVEEVNAEYEVLSRIVSQKIGLPVASEEMN